jgi:hypothetical protein
MKSGYPPYPIDKKAFIILVFLWVTKKYISLPFLTLLTFINKVRRVRKVGKVK